MGQSVFSTGIASLFLFFNQGMVITRGMFDIEHSIGGSKQLVGARMVMRALSPNL